MVEDTPNPKIANLVAAVNLLRAVHRHYSQLSTMADFKANVVVGVTLIALANLAIRADLLISSPSLIILSIFLFISLIFALMALIPNLFYHKKHSEMPIDYLFFPMFIHMPFDEFESIITNMLSTEEGMIRSILVELYDLGVYLAKSKFRYINISYQILFFGIVISASTFAISFLINRF